MLTECSNALFSLSHSPLAFKRERLCNNAYGKYTKLLSYLSNNRSCTGACTAAHTCGNKYKRCTVQCFLNIIAVFLCRFSRNGRLSARTTTLGGLSAYLHTLHSTAVLSLKCRYIRVYYDKVNAFDVVSDHVLYCVSAAAANAYNFYLDVTLNLFFIEFKAHFCIPPFYLQIKLSTIIF